MRQNIRSIGRFGSLFTGVGGIDLGLEAAGWRCAWQVEREPFCRHVLEHRWPGVRRYGAIEEIDWLEVEPVELLAGGFPCQPFSLAGKRLGTDDIRWLWPEFARAIRALRPRIVLVENVAGLLVEYGGMGPLLGDLASLGFDAEWDCIPASAAGAPHQRTRVWVVAYANGDQRGAPGEDQAQARATELALDGGAFAGAQLSWLVADTNPPRPLDPICPGRHGARPGGEDVADPQSVTIGARLHARRQRRERRARSRYRRWWATEPRLGRVADGVPHRVDRLRALGNACVPQIVTAIAEGFR